MLISPYRNQINRKIPDYLVYKTQICRSMYNYKLFSTKSGKFLGEMDAHPMDSSCYNFETPLARSLNIEYLTAFERYKGVGTKLLDFAQVISKQLGCEGRLSLYSSNGYDEENPPHIFYRKYGFSSRNISKLNEIDKNIIEKAANPQFSFSGVGMFYPSKSKIGEYLPQKSLLSKIIEKLRTINLKKF